MSNEAFDRQSKAKKSDGKMSEEEKADVMYRSRAAKRGRAEDPRARKTKTHTVVSGDSLSAIARKYYDDADKWNDIYEANKETIGDNPNALRVGQELTIPNA